MYNTLLRSLRMAKNYKQETIANMLDMSQANFSDVENGKTKISPELAQKLGDIFDINPALFTTEKPIVFNHNFSDNSKAITNTENYFEMEKEVLLGLIQKMDSLFVQLQQEREAINTERVQVLLLLNKLTDRLA